MIIFDTLDELESYRQVVPELDVVIDVMDHSTPYEENVGEYLNPGKNKGVHITEAYLTSSKGFLKPNDIEKLYVEICLEGEELVSIEGSVFKLSSGRFLAHRGYTEIKKGLAFSLPIATKSVSFVF